VGTLPKLVPEPGDIIALVEIKCNGERYGLGRGSSLSAWQTLGTGFRGAGADFLRAREPINFSSAPYVGEYYRNMNAPQAVGLSPAKLTPAQLGRRTPSSAGQRQLGTKQDQTISSIWQGARLGDLRQRRKIYIWRGTKSADSMPGAMPYVRGRL